MELAERPAWQAHAACRELDPILFFEGPFAEARAVCGMCPVKADCLAFALPDPSILGLWGGTTERQRKRLRKRDHSARQTPT